MDYEKEMARVVQERWRAQERSAPAPAVEERNWSAKLSECRKATAQLHALADQLRNTIEPVLLPDQTIRSGIEKPLGSVPVKTSSAIIRSLEELHEDLQTVADALRSTINRIDL